MMVEDRGPLASEDTHIKTVNKNQSKAQSTGKIVPIGPARKSATPAAMLPTIREEYGLSRPLFGRLIGVDEETLSKWENSAELAKDAHTRVQKVADLLRGLSRVLPKAELAGWLTKPNNACRSAGADTPADLFEKGCYDQIEAMIYFFESGGAF
jgi:DNA-binding transcriptional regulator YiaG